MIQLLKLVEGKFNIYCAASSQSAIKTTYTSQPPRTAVDTLYTAQPQITQQQIHYALCSLNTLQ